MLQKHRPLTAGLLACTLLLFSCSKKDSTPATPASLANFTYSGNGTAPSLVSFTNSSSNATSYSWDFGDNATSTLINPTRTYSQGGVHTVKLTASGSGGTNSVTKTVNITTPTSVKITGIKVTALPITTSSGVDGITIQVPMFIIRLVIPQPHWLRLQPIFKMSQLPCCPYLLP
jgi:PKD repeat protein